LIAERVLEVGDGYRAKNSELGEPGLPFLRAGNLSNGFDTDGADVLNEASVARAGSKISRVADVAFTSKGTIGRISRVGEHDATEPRLVRQSLCRAQSRTLAELRDTLLPKLLSGELRVRDAERLVGAACS